MGKVWNKAEIIKLLETNDKMVFRSVVKLYEYQTDTEQDNAETHVRNGVGFNGHDAAFLSSIAVQVKAGRPMSAKQLNATRRALLKYSGQLVKIANTQTA